MKTTCKQGHELRFEYGIYQCYECRSAITKEQIKGSEIDDDNRI